MSSFSIEFGLLPGGTNADRLIGRRLRHLRLAQGITIADVVAAFVCRDKDVASVEAGELRPNASLLYAIAKFYRCQFSDLFEPG